VEVSISDLQKMVDHDRAIMTEWYAKYKGNSFTLFYEDILPDHNGAMPLPIANQLCDFIEVQRLPLFTKMQKMNRDYSKVIKNWNELEASIENRYFEV
jgi:hypothetical protein